MTTAIIAAAAALAGVVLGRFLDTWSERRRWAREQRLNVYGDFSSAVQRYGLHVAYMQQAHPESPRGVLGNDETHALYREAIDSYGRIILIGSRRGRSDAASDVAICLEAFANEDIADDSPMSRAIAEFRKACRGDLGTS